MRFLKFSDYEPYIKVDNLLSIVSQNPDLMEEIEETNILKIYQYTGNFFDNSCLFPTILDWDGSTSYVIGDYVYNSTTNLIYVATTDIATPNLITDAGWKISDPRNSLIKQILIDMCLYDVNARIAPNQVQSLRVKRHDDCIKMLKNFAQGLTGGLPTECLLSNDNSDGGSTDGGISWGSERKTNNYW